MPPALASVQPQDLLPEHGLFLYALNTQPAGVTGYKLVSSGSTFATKQIWHMHLSSDDYPQRILRAAAHPPNGKYSKYLNTIANSIYRGSNFQLFKQNMCTQSVEFSVTET